MDKTLHEAKWWKSETANSVKCFLCPRGCVIAEGKSGFCAVRKNIEGTLYSLAYARPVALQVDPIEKKPLAEFMGGTYTFSIGTYGCNLDCSFCQNNLLSRGCYEDAQEENFFSPEDIVDLAFKHKCQSIAFTYNEPTVFAEYAVDISKLAHEQGLSTVWVSNGFITLDAAKEVFPLLDAANIDMKGFSENFYKSMTASSLNPVLEAIAYYHSLGKHLELTNLVIPGKNDSEEMIDAFLNWVETKLDKNVPLHFSAYHPAYHYHESPMTPAETLYKMRDKANAQGFKHVYLGNIR